MHIFKCNLYILFFHTLSLLLIHTLQGSGVTMAFKRWIKHKTVLESGVSGAAGMCARCGQGIISPTVRRRAWRLIPVTGRIISHPATEQRVPLSPVDSWSSGEIAWNKTVCARDEGKEGESGGVTDLVTEGGRKCKASMKTSIEWEAKYKGERELRRERAAVLVIRWMNVKVEGVSMKTMSVWVEYENERRVWVSSEWEVGKLKREFEIKEGRDSYIDVSAFWKWVSEQVNERVNERVRK